MKKFTEQAIKKRIRDFDVKLHLFMLECHDEVYMDDIRDPGRDENLVEEYDEAYENVKNAVFPVLKRELAKLGK